MFNKLLLSILTSVTFVGSSCSLVSIKGPLDIEPRLIEEIEGVWSGPEGEIFWVKNYGENKVKIGGLEWDQGNDQWILHQDNLILAHDIFYSETDMAGGLIFVDINFFESNRDRENQFIFGKCLLSDSNLVVWIPDQKSINKLIESGEIKGKVKSSDTEILDSVAKLIEKVKEQEGTNLPDLFRYKEPVIYKKIAEIPKGRL